MLANQLSCQPRLIAAPPQTPRLQHSSRGSDSLLCPSSRSSKADSHSAPSNLPANQTSRSQKRTYRIFHIRRTYRFVSQTEKNTISVVAEAFPINRPNDPRLPNRDAASNPIQLSAASFRPRGILTASPTTAWPPKRRRFARRPLYSLEFRADLRRYLIWEMVKANQVFPVRINALRNKAKNVQGPFGPQTLTGTLDITKTKVSISSPIHRGNWD
jgi:hypothetical protein